MTGDIWKLKTQLLSTFWFILTWSHAEDIVPNALLVRVLFIPTPQWVPEEDEDGDGNEDGLPFLSSTFWIIPTWSGAQDMVPNMLLVRGSFIPITSVSA